MRYSSSSAIVCAGAEISERKRAEDQLSEAQQRPETILASISDEFFAVDREWRYTYVNERGLAKATQIPGVLTPADLLGKNIWERFPELLGTTFDHEAHRAMRDQTAIDIETYSPVTKRWLEARMYPSDAGLSVYLHDISARKEAEEALRDTHRRMEDILESIGDSFFAVDRDWRYTYLNQRALGQARGALGRDVSAEELVGQSCWDTFPEWVGTAVYDAYQHALLEQKAVELEVYVERTGGWFAVRLYPSAEGVSTYLRDITERKRANEQLAYHASLLDNVEDAVIATDAVDFRITAWNRGAERLYGYSAG